MDRVSLKNYCDKKAQGNVYSSFSSRGKAIACSVAYPTGESRSDIACEKLCSISADCFLRRPSLCDEAMGAIAGFINEGIYLDQEPNKVFLCSAAILYIFRGRARCFATGNSRVYHFRDGRLTEVSRGNGVILFGKKVRWEQKAAPEFELLPEKNIFLLCSGAENTDFDKIMKDMEQDSALTAAEDVVPETLIEQFSGKKCSATAIILPEVRRSLFPIWGRAREERRGHKNE